MVYIVNRYSIVQVFLKTDSKIFCCQLKQLRQLNLGINRQHFYNNNHYSYYDQHQVYNDYQVYKIPILYQKLNPELKMNEDLPRVCKTINHKTNKKLIKKNF